MRSRTGVPRDTSLINDLAVLDHLADKLVTLGAGPDVVADIRQVWNDPLTPESWRYSVNAMGDTALRGEIAEAQHDRDQRTGPDEHMDHVRMAAADAAAGQLIDQTSNVRELLDRVGQDPELAAAVLRLERAGTNRVTVTRVLEAIADAAP